MTFDIADHVDAVTAMVQAASVLALDWFRVPLEIENKGTDRRSDAQVERFDPVTKADRAVEDALRAALQDRFGDQHQILGEERGLSGSGDYRWVIDPIDGTRAFIAGQPLWGTLLGLQRGDQVLAGWLHQPTLGHTYVASPAGAWLIEPDQRRRLATRSTTSVEDAVLLCTHPDMFATSDEQAAFGRVDARARLTRYSGDCINYGYVASGFADVVIENQLQPYDIIPLIPIIEGAGGVITDREGGAATSGGWAIAAATPELHAEVLDLLRG
jgi:histidinol phosphatase-like enzyme (inositol monophosphatase family)